MLEVIDDMLCLMGSKGCIVRVSGELTSSSDDTSVVAVGWQVTDA